jgi:Ca2+/Na+ antiporter
MKKEIKSINGKQTAKVVAITGAWFSLIFTIVGIVMLIAGISSGNEAIKFSGMFYILMPFCYLILVYLFSRLLYYVYNKVAAKFGGAVVDLEDVKE